MAKKKKKKLKQRWLMGEMMYKFGISRRRLEYLIETRKIEPIGFTKGKQRVFDRAAFVQLRQIVREQS